MSLTCDGAGLLWPNVAWRLALLAPNLAPGDIVSHVNVRTAAANFDAGSRPSTIKELQLWKLPRRSRWRRRARCDVLADANGAWRGIRACGAR
jgi:hypothetical protein